MVGLDARATMDLWKAYQKNYSYAVDISWHIVMESVRYLYQIGCSVDF